MSTTYPIILECGKHGTRCLIHSAKTGHLDEIMSNKLVNCTGNCWQFWTVRTQQNYLLGVDEAVQYGLLIADPPEIAG